MSCTAPLRYSTALPLARTSRHSTSASEPSAPVRWINHWDNLDGTIERGYAGRSIFWENGHVLDDLTRVRDYGRLLASVGINGCSINNVNAERAVDHAGVPAAGRADRGRVAAVGRARCRSRSTSAARAKIGGLDTFDPLDPRVAAFWKDASTRSTRAIPDLGGFVLKADPRAGSGRPSTAARHADAANVIARALASRTAACCSIAASSTTTAWTGAT